MGSQTKRARRKDQLDRMRLAADAAARIQQPRFDGDGEFVLSTAVVEYGHRTAPYPVRRTPDGDVFMFKPSANMVDVELAEDDDDDIATTIAPYMVDPSQAAAFVGDSFTLDEMNTLLEGLYGVTPSRAGKRPGSDS